MKRLAVIASIALWTAGPGFAQSVYPAAPAAPTPSVFPTLVALAAVIAAIVIFGWIMKKLSPAGHASGHLLRAVSQLPVGPKERVVVVQFQSKWLVLGVTASAIHLLNETEAPINVASDGGHDTGAGPGASAPFAKWLQQTLTARKS
jgi:flagellar protein FliO/FliZ